MQHSELLLVLDFGSQYTQLIARRVRELGVYSEIHPFNISIDKIRSLRPVGIILSGGPSSVYELGAPKPSPEVLNLGIPVLGICYGLQLIAEQLGGKVDSFEESSGKLSCMSTKVTTCCKALMVRPPSG